MLSLTNLGKNMRTFRKEQDLTLQQIANKAHTEASTISQWENGKRKPNLMSILTLCDNLNTSVEELFKLPHSLSVTRILTRCLQQKHIEYTLDADSLIHVLHHLLSPSESRIGIRIKFELF